MPYTPPRKCILTKEQMEAFQASKTHADVVSYIETLNNSVIGVKLTDECSASEVGMCTCFDVLSSWRGMNLCIWTTQGVTSALSMLDKVEEIARETPPVDNSGSRFGNPAFRTFYDRVTEVNMTILLSPSVSLKILIGRHQRPSTRRS